MRKPNTPTYKTLNWPAYRAIEAPLVRAQWRGSRSSTEVVHSESLGADSFVHLDIGDEDLMTLRLPGDVEIPPGTRLSVSPVKGRAHFFDANGRPVAA